MNVELLQAALSAHGRRLVVLDDGEAEEDLVQDTVEVLTSFCARRYGRRLAKGRARKALEPADHGGLSAPPCRSAVRRAQPGGCVDPWPPEEPDGEGSCGSLVTILVRWPRVIRRPGARPVWTTTAMRGPIGNAP